MTDQELKYAKDLSFTIARLEADLHLAQTVAGHGQELIFPEARLKVQSIIVEDLTRQLTETRRNFALFSVQPSPPDTIKI